MSESSAMPHSTPRRIFISYSRADRERVKGLYALLEALGHRVFMDERSIRAGRRWKRALADELHAADVMLVFWTRHAARSDWVRQEYEQFGAEHADCPLVPVLGDSTPLSEMLAEHQHSDFCPLLNELLAMIADLEAKGVSKRQIRVAVTKRLNEEGIELNEDKRNRLYATFGVLGLTIAPLHFLQTGRDVLIDGILAVPSAYFYTAGTAAIVGFVTCHGLAGLGASDRVAAPDLYPVDIGLNESGSDACDAQGMICVSVARASVHDEQERFFGYSTPTCSARVVRKSGCQESFQTDFALQGVVVRRAPDADPDATLSNNTFFCLMSDLGKSGAYAHANCVKP